MKARRDFAVNQHGEVHPDSHLTILYVAPGVFSLCEDSRDLFVADCLSAKRLSDWAFENGAQSVKHAYDLKLSDGEA